jgi:hypothetical protein
MKMQNPPPKPSLFQLLLTVLGAFCGIQTHQTHTQAVKSGRSPWPYLILGVLLSLILVALLIFLAQTFIQWEMKPA